jgi:hypothetical protein
MVYFDLLKELFQYVFELVAEGLEINCSSLFLTGVLKNS